MVIKNGLEIRLVDAETKKFMFPEHQSGHLTYVEAEPKAEYFIATRRLSPGKDNQALMLRITVDNQDLGPGYMHYRSTEWKYRGLRQGDKRVALLFVTPEAVSSSSTTATSAYSGEGTMPLGNIKVIVQEATIIGKGSKGRSKVFKTLRMPEMSGMVKRELAKKKFIGSKAGETSLMPNKGCGYKIKLGLVVHSIDIKYATYHALVFNRIIKY